MLKTHYAGGWTMERNPIARTLFPTTLYRDVRSLRHEVFGEGGLKAEIRQLKRQQSATFWVALSTFATMVAGVGSLIVGMLHGHL